MQLTGLQVELLKLRNQKQSEGDAYLQYVGNGYLNNFDGEMREMQLGGNQFLAKETEVNTGNTENKTNFPQVTSEMLRADSGVKLYEYNPLAYQAKEFDESKLVTELPKNGNNGNGNNGNGSNGDSQEKFAEWKKILIVVGIAFVLVLIFKNNK